MSTLTGMSPVGRWDAWYEHAQEPAPYGDETTYRLGAAFLEPCSLVEDWGCGLGWMARHVGPERYRGVDGSSTRFATVHADLATYRSDADGIFIRHVLEHDDRYGRILANALQSFGCRLVLVIYTPLSDELRELGIDRESGIRELALPRGEIASALDQFHWTFERVRSDTAYGCESVYYVERRSTVRRSPRVSVVVVSRNEGSDLGHTVDALLGHLGEGDELIVVDDESTDGSADDVAGIDPRLIVHRAPRRLGVAGARNRGVELASGDLLVFADAHVEPLGPWLTAMQTVLRDAEVGAVSVALVDRASGAKGYGLRFVDAATNLAWIESAGRGPQPVPLLPGAFLAILRDVFVAVGGFDPGMRGYGIEDNEFSLRLWSLGYRCLLLPEVEVLHGSSASQPRDYYDEWQTSLHNILRLGVVHYGPRRLEQMLRLYRDDNSLPGALAAVLASDATKRREAVQAARTYDDEWFFTFCGVD
jgi:GT2 family glycosyltransferase